MARELFAGGSIIQRLICLIMQKCGQNIENIEISGLKNDRNNQGFVRNINTHISTICSNVG